MSKYLIYSNTGLSSKQIGLTIDFIDKCKREGIEIKIVRCNNILENCYFNPVKNLIACASCQGRVSSLLNQIKVLPNEMVSLKTFPINIRFPDFKNLDELLAFSYDGVNIGRGVASSIISYYRDYYLSSEKHGDLINLELKKAVNVYHNIKEIIADYKPDKVVLFNGRFAEVFPVIAYCEKRNISYTTIEAGALNNYELFENSLPHSIRNRTSKMLELWEGNKNKEEKEAIGREWFRKKRFGDETIERSFTKDQLKGALPRDFDENQTNVLLLNSSEDELKAIHEWNTDLYSSQNEAINRVMKHYENISNIHFYLRVHPNLGKIDNIQIKEIDAMDFTNLTIIGPNEKIDTYALMDACDKSIVFGSTSGIEATYWGNVSILLGKSFYYYLENSCYKPSSFEELFGLLETADLPAKSKNACLPYGYYFSSYGIPTENFCYRGLKNSTYKGKKIKTWYPISFIYLVKYLCSYNQWHTAYTAVRKVKLRLKDFLRYKV